MKRYVYATVKFGKEDVWQAWDLIHKPGSSFLIVTNLRDNSDLVIKLDNRMFKPDKSVGPQECVYSEPVSVADAVIRQKGK